MSIYNQSQITWSAQPNTLYVLVDVPQEDGSTRPALVNVSEADHQFQLVYHETIRSFRLVLFHRNDSCQGLVSFYVLDDSSTILPGTPQSCSLQGTPIHTMDYVLDDPLPPNTNVYFAIKTSSDFSTQDITIDWINMVLFQ